MAGTLTVVCSETCVDTLLMQQFDRSVMPINTVHKETGMLKRNPENRLQAFDGHCRY